jgi:transposase InsO family protein
MPPKNSKNKYDTFMVWLYSQNKEHLIPENIRREIPYSTISGWRGLDYSSYVGHEVSILQKQAIEQYELFEAHKNLKKIVFTFSKLWVQLSNVVLPVLTKSKENKVLVLESLQQLFQVLPKKVALHIFNISPTTFYNWMAVEKVNCGLSPIDLCYKRHPLQLAKVEVEKITTLFKNTDFQCWPASSIYYYALRENELSISLSTFYKYVNLLGLKRKWKKSIFEKTNPLVTTKPNEYIHIDTTFWTLTNGIKAAIVLVCDNFSKNILGWNISLKKDGENAKAALCKAVETIQKHHPDLPSTILVTDGGGENHNKIIDEYLTNLAMPEISKILALKDELFSNSAIEAINKIIKRYLRKELPNTFEELVESIEDIIHDYTTIRPHGSLKGLTPIECYTSQNVNIDFSQQKIQAKINRIEQNKSVNCSLIECKLNESTLLNVC